MKRKEIKWEPDKPISRPLNEVDLVDQNGVHYTRRIDFGWDGED